MTPTPLPSSPLALLAPFCSPPVPDPESRPPFRIEESALPFDLAQTAERHGMAPLIFRAVSINRDLFHDRTLKTLRVQALRTRNKVTIYMETLKEILDALSRKSIPCMALKGGALCQLIYPDPGLRPMGDLDLLVSPQDSSRAWDILTGMGFSGDPGTGTRHHSRHAMPPLSKTVDGITVQIDLHRNVFTNLHPASLEITDVEKPLVFSVLGQEAVTLGQEQMLWHLCHHLVTPGQPVKLISIADILWHASRYADTINWNRIRKRYPFVITTLNMLDLLVPIPETVRQAAAIRHSRPVNDVGKDYTGWPNTPFPGYGASPGSYTNLIAASLSAPDWWLRLYYGYNPAWPIWYCRAVLHPLRLFRMAASWYFL